MKIEFISIKISIENVIEILNVNETEIGNDFSLDYKSENREFDAEANKSAIESVNDRHYCPRSLHELEYTPLRP